ncbi:MAG: DUF2914 domain-containing protein [Deferrisomatales bacterium]|nr:DUF2914 domain-containing protein [Deferrisomatales bacterium]
MRRWGWKVGLTVLLVLAASLATAGEATVLDAVLATGVENRQPVGTANTFPADVGRVYAYTRVVGAAGEGSVTHVWYYAGQVKAQVQLSVRSDDWRTWSSKTILPGWTGEWLVEVQGADGRVLASVPFQVE